MWGPHIQTAYWGRCHKTAFARPFKTEHGFDGLSWEMGWGRCQGWEQNL